MLRHIEYLAKSLNFTRGHSKCHLSVRHDSPLYYSIVTMSVSRTFLRYSAVVTLKYGLWVRQGY